MSRMPRVTGKEIMSAFIRQGYRLIHVRGSHHYLEPPDGQGLVTVPVHAGKIIKPRTLKSILDQAGLSVDELIKIL